MTLKEQVARTLFELDYYPDLPDVSFDDLPQFAKDIEQTRATRFIEALGAHGYQFYFNPTGGLTPLEREYGTKPK